MMSLGEIIEVIKMIVMIIINKIGLIIHEMWQAFRGYWQRGQSEENEKYKTEYELCNSKGVTKTLWDEFTINNEMQELDNEEQMIQKVGSIAVCRAIYIRRGLVTTVRINTNFSVVPRILENDIESIDEYKTIVSQVGVKHIVCNIKTPVGKIIISEESASEILKKSGQKMYSLNKHVLINKQVKRQIGLYGSKYENAEAIVVVKTDDPSTDKMITTNVHTLTTLMLLSKKRYNKQVGAITMLLPWNTQYVYKGAMVRVKKMPFVIFDYRLLQDKDLVIAIASPLIDHDQHYVMEVFSGDEVD